MTEEQVESAVIPEVESEDWEAAVAREAVRFKAGPPAYQRDRFFYRVVVFTLGFVALGALVGSIYLAAAGQKVPESVVALGSTAVGALAGVLITGRT